MHFMVTSEQQMKEYQVNELQENLKSIRLRDANSHLPCQMTYWAQRLLAYQSQSDSGQVSYITPAQSASELAVKNKITIDSSIRMEIFCMLYTSGRRNC